MALERYEYPEILYCEKCDTDVGTEIIERTGTYVNSDEIGQYKYRAAICPICGHTLCERDKEIAFVIHISKGRSDGQ